MDARIRNVDAVFILKSSIGALPSCNAAAATAEGKCRIFDICSAVAYRNYLHQHFQLVEQTAWITYQKGNQSGQQSNSGRSKRLPSYLQGPAQLLVFHRPGYSSKSSRKFAIVPYPDSCKTQLGKILNSHSEQRQLEQVQRHSQHTCCGSLCCRPLGFYSLEWLSVNSIPHYSGAEAGPYVQTG